MTTVVMFIISVVLSSSLAVPLSVLDESKCSTFEYEYRVLEKIINLENANVELGRKQRELDLQNQELMKTVKEQSLEMKSLKQVQEEERKNVTKFIENLERVNMEQDIERTNMNKDFKAELIGIATNVEKLNATNEKQGQIIQENNRLHNEDRGNLWLAVLKIESDFEVELTRIATNVEKLNATFEEQGQTIQENNRLHNEDTGNLWLAVRKIESGWPRVNATHVSFSARLGHNKKYTSRETLVFKYIFNNDGGAYNASTGIFTAPVDGKYWFSASITVYYQASADVYIMKNNDYTVRASPDSRGPSTNLDMATVSTVMDLKSGDTVYCRWYSGTTTTSYSVYHFDLNSFSGALLTQY